MKGGTGFLPTLGPTSIGGLGVAFFIADAGNEGGTGFLIAVELLVMGGGAFDGGGGFFPLCGEPVLDPIIFCASVEGGRGGGAALPDAGITVATFMPGGGGGGTLGLPARLGGAGGGGDEPAIPGGGNNTDPLLEPPAGGATPGGGGGIPPGRPMPGGGGWFIIFLKKQSEIRGADLIYGK